MAVLALTDASITINSVSLGNRANSVSINYEIDALEATAFGTQHIFVGGLQNLSVEIALMQDFAASNVEATVYGLVGTTTTLVIKPTSSAVGATNPSYTITGAYLAAHTPVAGAVGELAMTTLSFTGGSIAKAVA
jgi:hypothetical protein